VVPLVNRVDFFVDKIIPFAEILGCPLKGNHTVSYRQTIACGTSPKCGLNDNMLCRSRFEGLLLLHRGLITADAAAAASLGRTYRSDCTVKRRKRLVSWQEPPEKNLFRTVPKFRTLSHLPLQSLRFIFEEADLREKRESRLSKSRTGSSLPPSAN
jgi:hypothetical protein